MEKIPFIVCHLFEDCVKISAGDCTAARKVHLNVLSSFEGVLVVLHNFERFCVSRVGF